MTGVYSLLIFLSQVISVSLNGLWGLSPSRHPSQGLECCLSRLVELQQLKCPVCRMTKVCSHG
jgi:hypothetical protein